jgi:hypothetical protein
LNINTKKKVRFMKQQENKILNKKPSIKVAFYGLGAIGSSIARLLLKKKGVRIVAAIDSDPEKVGRDLGEVINAQALGIVVSNNPSKTLSEEKPDVAVHATSSFLKDVFEQLTLLVRRGVNVVSTCEELSYPWIADKNLASELDKLAKQNRVTVLGTGINPGFLMDTLPITLTGVCQEIKSIKVERVMDAADRRIPFQKKIGAGLTVEEFGNQIGNRQITGHVGLKQSVAMIADALGLDLQSIKVGAIEPVIARRPVESKAAKVKRGDVAGLSQSAYGVKDGKPIITLLFKAFIGAEEEYDSVTIEGTPSIKQKMTPCVHGDYGTAAIVVNSIPKVISSEPGLKTMKDLPIPSAVTGDLKRHIRR